MKNCFFLLLGMLFVQVAFTQSCDYTKDKYGFRVEKGILFGIEPDFQGKPDSLFVDIYYPTGSPEVNRPLVIWSFGGGFIAGQRQDFAAICESCAKKGFVAATIDYRIGFNGISILPNDSAEVIRAGFRGAQDGKSALRFLKARHVEDSIDLNRVWVGGASAGSIVALATAFYNKDSEKPLEAGTISSTNGNERNDLGSIQGNSNINGYDSKVQGVFNLFGAVLNLDIIDKDDNIAVFSYHQTLDPVVPCAHRRAYWSYPVVTDRYPYANGSCEIDPKLTELNLNPAYHKAWIYNGNQHAVHNETEVFNFMLENANPILCGTVATQNIRSNDLSNLEVFPNPAQDELFLKNQESNLNYSIIDMNGKLIKSGKLLEHKSIQISDIESGIYVLTLQKNESSRRIKFIKAN